MPGGGMPGGGMPGGGMPGGGIPGGIIPGGIIPGGIPWYERSCQNRTQTWGAGLCVPEAFQRAACLAGACLVASLLAHGVLEIRSEC
eukprot:COSAG01_NODE_5655_length_4115_cov_4.372330_2_plen_87_part_00